MNNVDEFVYRVFKEPEFYRFKKYKFFEGNKLDKDSGFIHLSTNDQINGTIQKYFCDENIFQKNHNLATLATKCLLKGVFANCPFRLVFEFWPSLGLSPLFGAPTHTQRQQSLPQ